MHNGTAELPDLVPFGASVLYFCLTRNTRNAMSRNYKKVRLNTLVQTYKGDSTETETKIPVAILVSDQKVFIFHRSGSKVQFKSNLIMTVSICIQ